jgi:large subunit ribosomal protein L9
MEVILLERIENLGQMGDVVNVKPGYARNFLLPHNKALRATTENRKVFEERRTQFEAENFAQRTEAESVAAKVEGLTITLLRQAGEAGQLYGSVNARDIADGTTEAGVRINRQQVRLDRPIKAIGLHQIRVDLHPEVQIEVLANVARSAEEAIIQERTGRAITTTEEEEAPEEPGPEAFEKGGGPKPEIEAEDADPAEPAPESATGPIEEAGAASPETPEGDQDQPERSDS